MTLTDIAEEFAMEGFNPLPLREDKRPALKENPFLYVPIDNIPIRFARAKKIGIACGKVSDGFICIDFDAKAKQPIEQVFRTFIEDDVIRQLIREQAIVIAQTPSEGYHIYLKCHTEHHNSVFARWPDGMTMIESRGTGGYVVVPPSTGYKVLQNEILKLQHIPVEVFNYLIERATSFNQHVNEYSPTTKQSTSTRKWPERWPNDNPVNKFKNEGEMVAKELLINAGWKYVSKRSDGVELWERPNKDEGSTSATWGAKFNMFYVFSTDAAPFQANCAYNPFDILTILKFAGDWRAAKASLMPIVEEEEQPVIETPFFPIDVFPSDMQEHISELKRTLNFHPDFTAVAAMFAIATINGNCFKLRVKNGWEASTIFWFAVVGFPGTIKTHPVKTMLKPLTEIDAKSKRKYDKQLAEYQAEIEAETKPKPKKPLFKQTIISDYTVEALHSIHSINTRGLGLYKDELKGFLNDMNKYRKGSDEEFWLESFNNGSYIVNRVTKDPIMIENINVNIIGTIQHDVLYKVVTEYAGNGLIDRFLFTAAEDKVYPLNAEELDPVYEQFWRMKLENMDEVFQYDPEHGSTIVQMTPEAFELYQQYDLEYVNIQNSQEYNQELKNYLSKMKTYIPRFALLLAIIDTIYAGVIPEVGKRQMKGAKRIADYFVKTATAVFSSTDLRRDIQSVEQSLKGKTRDEKIKQLYSAGFKQVEIGKYFGISHQAVGKVLKK